MIEVTSRSILELLYLLLANKHHFQFGLCRWCFRLHMASIISLRELTRLQIFIEGREPAVFLDSPYWWPAGDIAPRIKWIEEQIKLLENEKPK